MVIFNSYVKLPEGIYFFRPQFIKCPHDNADFPIIFLNIFPLDNWLKNQNGTSPTNDFAE